MSDDLNPEQREAVEHRGGPLLVLAGAGSGKTRVITHRIASLLADGIPASAIVAMTFTNKAAAEMRTRVEKLVGEAAAGLFLGTFHAWGLRLLRRHARHLDLRNDFTVYDRTDQLGVIKECLVDSGIDVERTTPRQALELLSRARSRLETLPPFAELYADKLRRRGAVDFDDLLLLPLELMKGNDELRQRLRPRQLLVDEFQDTSPAQCALVEQLWPEGHGVAVVGDEDQAIYGFRGASVGNILDFSKRHPGTEVIRLVRNYRSTAAILAAASSLVERNQERLGKTLKAELGAGQPVTVVRCRSAEHEADVIGGRARLMVSRLGAGEVAVLYRTNAQSRAIEEAFVRMGVPYELVKGVRFYERREVKDVLAYLRVLAPGDDDAAFDRILNVPARGIGAAARDEIAATVAAEGGSMAAAAAAVAAAGTGAGRRIQGFLDLIARLRRQSRDRPVAETIRAVVKDSGYDRYLERDADKSGEGAAGRRAENIDELVAKASMGELSGLDGIASFLDDVTVSSEPDREGEGAVSLMTLHNAKGLEFRGVIIAGLEDGLLPHGSSSGWGSDGELEEERRLLYVGMTRAREELILTHAFSRRLFIDGGSNTRPSRFLDEIDQTLLRFEGEKPVERESAPVSRPSYSGRPRPAPPSRGATAPAARAPAVSDKAVGPFAKGSWVRHAKYGEGMVIDREGGGDALKLTVRFSTGMRKKLVAKFANLTAVKRNLPK